MHEPKIIKAILRINERYVIADDGHIYRESFIDKQGKKRAPKKMSKHSSGRYYIDGVLQKKELLETTPILEPYVLYYLYWER